MIKDNIEGRVVIKFIIDQKGFARDVGFLQSLHPEIEKQCVEMIKKLPRFKPVEGFAKSIKGWYWGFIKTWYVLPIYFSPTEKCAKNIKLVISP